jgi:IS1 family transposase
MWSFVGNKANKQWIWLALEVDSRAIVGCFVGSRDREGAKGLWDSLPPVYRQCAVCYTDFWKSYEEIFPDKRLLPPAKNGPVFAVLWTHLKVADFEDGAVRAAV